MFFCTYFKYNKSNVVLCNILSSENRNILTLRHLMSQNCYHKNKMKQQKLTEFFGNPDERLRLRKKFVRKYTKDILDDNDDVSLKRMKGIKNQKQDIFSTPSKSSRPNTSPFNNHNNKDSHPIPLLTPINNNKSKNEITTTTTIIIEDDEDEDEMKIDDEIELKKKTEPSKPYEFLSKVFDEMSKTRKRLEIADLLKQAFSELITKVSDDLLPCVYLCVNEICPAHEGLELGIGDSIIIKAMSEAFGRPVSDIKKAYQKYGDLGTAALKEKHKQKLLKKFNSLTIQSVYHDLYEIAKIKGESSVERKRKIITKLISESKKNEIAYIVRSLKGKLRIGLAEQTVFMALGQAIYEHIDKGHDAQQDDRGSSELAVQNVKQAFSMCPSYDKLIPALLKYGALNILEYISFVPGVPIQPMLAKPTKGISEVLDKFSDSDFTCEFKYDGERVQVHVFENVVKLFSRNAEETSEKYPDIVKMVPENLKAQVKSLVVDAEAVAWDPLEQKMLPFQLLSTRARKDVNLEDIKIKVCVFCFDCLYLNGESLLQKPLKERREALYSAINESKGIIEFAKAENSNNIDDLQVFLDKAVETGTEGLIVKTCDATYEPSKRSLNWLKLKKDYLDGLGDSFDVIPIGGMYGSFLLAIYDKINEEYQTICKIGTGFSDELLKECSDKLKTIKIKEAKKNYRYSETLVPDVWFDAKEVWEIKAADLSMSPVHKAALGILDETKGISIRFPRLVRVRDDKSPQDATSVEQVVEMFKNQDLKYD